MNGLPRAFRGIAGSVALRHQFAACRFLWLRSGVCSLPLVIVSPTMPMVEYYEPSMQIYQNKEKKAISID
jgi:hypothetical protein